MRGIPWLARIAKRIGPATLLLAASQLVLLQAMLVVSRRLGPAGYGSFGLAMAMNLVCSQFMQWGMDPLLAVKFSRGLPEDNRRIYGMVLRQRQLFAAAILLIALPAAFFWPSPSEAALLYLGAVDGVIAGFALAPAFDARGRTALWQLFAFVRFAAYLLITLALVRAFPQSVTPLSILVVHALCIVPEIVLEQVWIVRTYGRPEWPAPLSGAFALMKEAAPLAIALLTGQLLRVSGVLALRAFGQERDLGALYLSNQIVGVSTALLTVPISMLHAKLAALHLQPEVFRRVAWRAILLCAIVGLLSSVALAAVSNWAVPLIFGTQFAAAAGILSVDAWRLLPFLAAAPLASILVCSGYLRTLAAVNVFGLASGLGWAIWRVPSEGGRGAAAAIVVGHCASFAAAAGAVWLIRKGER